MLLGKALDLLGLVLLARAESLELEKLVILLDVFVRRRLSILLELLVHVAQLVLLRLYLGLRVQHLVQLALRPLERLTPYGAVRSDSRGP